METYAPDARAVASASAASPCGELSPLVAPRCALLPMRFAASEVACGHQESAGGNGNHLAVDDHGGAKKRALEEEEKEDGEISEDDDDGAALPPKRARLVVVDDDETEDDEPALITESNGDGVDDDYDGEEEEGAGRAAGSGRAANGPFLRRGRLSDEETEDEFIKTSDSNDDAVAPTPDNHGNDTEQTTSSGASETNVVDDASVADERLMRLVMEKKALSLGSKHRMTKATWRMIARELNDDRLQTGDDAESHTKGLLDAWYARPSSEREVSSLALDVLLREYAKITRRTKPSKAGKVDDNQEPSKKQAKSARESSSIRVLHTRSGRAASVQTSSDELLVKVVLQHRVGLISVATVMDTWQTVADAIAPKLPHFKSGSAAKTRFERLVKTHEGIHDQGEVCVAEHIRAQLDEFVQVSTRDQADVLMRIVDQHRSDAVTRHMPSNNDQLLREVLRVKPFLRKLPEQKTAWNEVALKANLKTFSTGSRCRQRIKSLLKTASEGASSPTMLVQELIRLHLIDAAMSWHSNGSERLLRELGKLLEKADIEVEERSSISIREVVKPASGTEIAQDTSANRRIFELDAERPVDFTEDPRQPEHSVLEPSESTDSAFVVVSHQEPTILETSTQSLMGHVVLEEAPSRVLRESAFGFNNGDRVREEHRAEIKSMFEMLKSEQEARHRETSAMIALMHQDRLDRHNEFVTMMEFVACAIAKPTKQDD